MPKIQLYSQLARWYQSDYGQLCHGVERDFLQRNVHDLSGQVLLGLGLSPLWLQLDTPPALPHSYHLIPELLLGNQIPGNVSVQTLPDLLPIQSNSVSVVVLHHALELSNHPHHLLREVDRVLIEDGHIVIIGFNPRSPLGLASWLQKWSSTTPPCTNKISLPRLKDWLTLLSFEVCHQQSALFRLPLGNIKLQRAITAFDRWGEALFPSLGNLYIIKARKRTIPMTLIGPRWSRTRRLTTPSLLKPTARQ